MHPTAWLFGCLAFFYTFRFWECRFSHAVVQLIEVRVHVPGVKMHVFNPTSSFICQPFLWDPSHCLHNKPAFCALPFAPWKHPAISDYDEWPTYISNILLNLLWPSLLRWNMEICLQWSKKKLWDFCVKPSSFAFKSLQLHSSLLQFVNIGSDFHIWFSTTFLGHQNKKHGLDNRPVIFRHGNDLRHLFFGWNLGAKLENQTCPNDKLYPPWN